MTIARIRKAYSNSHGSWCWWLCTKAEDYVLGTARSKEFDGSATDDLRDALDKLNEEYQSATVLTNWKYERVDGQWRLVTVRVRIAVAVDPSGDWHSCGWKGASDADIVSACKETLDYGDIVYWIESDLEVPTPKTAHGRLARDGGTMPDGSTESESPTSGDIAD